MLIENLSNSENEKGMTSFIILEKYVHTKINFASCIRSEK